jgi:hypothetical protein
MKRLGRWLRRLLVLAAVVTAACLIYDWTLQVTPRKGVQAAIGEVDAGRLRAHVERIAGFGPHPEGNAVATAAVLKWLEGELGTLGYEVQREPFDAPTLIMEALPEGKGFAQRVEMGRRHHNLIVEKHGSEAGLPVLEVGAHYDSVWWGPGADDNGSGVAALLEVARLLAAAAPKRSVRLLFFAMEEEGLVGSAAHVHQLQARRETIAGAIVLDMVGFVNREPGAQHTPLRVPLVFDPSTQGDFLVVAGNFASGWLGNVYEACADAYVPAAKYYSVNRLAGWFEDAVRSDHASYWRAGMHAILLTDTAEMRNPNYHRQSDVPSTCDYEFLRANAQALAATVLHWAGVE